MARRRIDGGGPWILSEEDDTPLSPGAARQYDLRRMTFRGQKGYFKPWLPVSTVLVKNFDDSNRVRVTYNDQFNATVGPNQADSFDRTGVMKIRVENRGETEISPDDLVVQAVVEPFGADDAARGKRKEHPVETAVKGVFNL